MVTVTLSDDDAAQLEVLLFRVAAMQDYDSITKEGREMAFRLHRTWVGARAIADQSLTPDPSVH